MGLKSNSNHFVGTNGSRRGLLLKMNIQLFAKLPSNDSQLKHILRSSEGHLVDNANNRKKLEKLTEDEKNYLGTDSQGKRWYAKQTAEGQLWASVYNGIISDGGINKKPISYIPGRGLKVNPIIRRKKK